MRQDRQKEFILLAFSLFLVLGFVEIFLRVTHLATEVALVQGDPQLGFKFIPNQAGTFVVGRFGDDKARFQINSDGWNSTRDYRQDHAAAIRIAIIGDSYVEALNVQPTNAVAAVLEKALSHRSEVEVYSFGISGASLSHYLAIMRYVRSRFSPDLYIVNIVHNDFHESLATADRAMFHGLRRAGSSYEEVPPTIYQPSLFRRIAGRSAMVRYLTMNLKVRFEPKDISRIHDLWGKTHRFAANIDAAKIDVRETKDLVNYIFKKYLQEAEGDRRKLVLVLDAPRQPIYEGMHPHTSLAFQYNKVVAEVCRDLFLYCLDLTDPFWSNFQRNRRRFNSVIDGHWNAYGHEVAAKAIEDFLFKNLLFPPSNYRFVS
jgi:hypothetical protein